MVAVGGVVVEIAVDPQGVGTAVDGQHQGVAFALEHHVGGQQASAQLDQINLAHRSVVGADGVFARSLAELVGVVTCTAVQGVVANATVQGVVTGLAVQRVIAVLALQVVGSVATVEAVVLRAATD